MKRKRFMQCNLLSINIFLEDFSNDNVVVHVRFELTIFVTTISRRFLPLKGIIMRTAKVVPEFLRTLVFARPRGDDQFADCTFSPSLDMSR